MVIFHSYISLPEGKSRLQTVGKCHIDPIRTTDVGHIPPGCQQPPYRNGHILVGGWPTHLKKLWKSVGMIITLW